MINDLKLYLIPLTLIHIFVANEDIFHQKDSVLDFLWFCFSFITTSAKLLWLLCYDYDDDCQVLKEINCVHKI